MARAWTLAIGAVHVMYVGAVIGAFEVEARELARTSSQKLERARIDIFDTHGPGRLIVLTLAGLLLIFVGFVLRLVLPSHPQLRRGGQVITQLGVRYPPYRPRTGIRASGWRC